MMSNFKDVSIRSRIAVIEALVKNSIAEKLNTDPEFVDLGYAYNLNDEAIDINISIFSTAQDKNSDIITETYGAKVIKSGDQTDIIELAIHIAKDMYNKITASEKIKECLT